MAFTEYENDIAPNFVLLTLHCSVNTLSILCQYFVLSCFPILAFTDYKSDIVPNSVLLTLPCGVNTCVTVGSALYERSFPALMIQQSGELV